jgi:aldoxime dehydratase
MAARRKYQDRLELRTYNEIFVLESDNPAFEYINCHPRTGLLPYFDSIECAPG